MTLAQDLRSDVSLPPKAGLFGLRHHCRNVRCGAKLKRPVDNPRDAFCCAGCFNSYFRGRCLVCERPFKRKTERRQVCGRSKCRHEFQRHRELFLGGRWLRANKKAAHALNGGGRHNGFRSAHFTGLKSNDGDGRAFHQVAGPVLSAEGLRLACLPPHTHLPRPVVIRRQHAPLNVVGGYRFPDTPKVPYVNGFAGKRGRDA